MDRDSSFQINDSIKFKKFVLFGSETKTFEVDSKSSFKDHIYSFYLYRKHKELELELERRRQQTAAARLARLENARDKTKAMRLVLAHLLSRKETLERAFGYAASKLCCSTKNISKIYQNNVHKSVRPLCRSNYKQIGSHQLSINKYPDYVVLASFCRVFKHSKFDWEISIQRVADALGVSCYNVRALVIERE